MLERSRLFRLCQLPSLACAAAAAVPYRTQLDSGLPWHKRQSCGKKKMTFVTPYTLSDICYAEQHRRWTLSAVHWVAHLQSWALRL